MDRARNQMTYDAECMAVSTENSTTLKSTKSRNSKSSARIQMKPKSEFKFAPRDTEKSEFPPDKLSEREREKERERESERANHEMCLWRFGGFCGCNNFR